VTASSENIPVNLLANSGFFTVKILDAPETISQGWRGSVPRFVEDFVQLANIAGDSVGRVVSVQPNSHHRSAACLRQDGIYTITLRGMAAVAEGAAVFSPKR
jgi:hypothetical protein